MWRWTNAHSMHACLVGMQAEKRMLEANENKEYLPIDGLPAFKKATVQLLLGSSHPAIQDVSLPVSPAFIRTTLQTLLGSSRSAVKQAMALPRWCVSNGKLDCTAAAGVLHPAVTLEPARYA